MMRDNISGLTILAVVAALCSAAKTQEDHANIEQWLTSVRQYRFGDSRQDLIRAERWVMTHAADDAERRWAAQRLGEMVTDSEATTEGRRFACRMLWVVGDERQVAALGSALDDPAMTDIARYALKGINAPQVDEQLRQALTSTTGDIRVGVITTIGHRRDDASTPLLIDLLDDDASTAAAAGRALGRIGTAAAADALRTARMKASGRLRNVLTHSLLDAAEHLIAAGQREQAASIYQALLEPAEPTRVKLAAMQGRVNLLTDEQTAAWLSSLARSHDPKMRVAAIQHLAQLKTPGVVSHLTAALTSDDVTMQQAAIGALVQRRDHSAAPAILKLAENTHDDSIRMACALALETVGDRHVVAAIARFAAGQSGAMRSTIRESLARMRGDGINEAIVAALDAAEPATRAELIRALGERHAYEQIGALMKVAADDGATNAIRRDALGTFAKLCKSSDCDRLLDLASRLEDQSLADAAMHALAAVAVRRPGGAEVLLKLTHDRAGEARDIAGVALLRALTRPSARSYGESIRMIDQVLALSDAQELRPLALSALAQLPHPRGLALAESLAQNQSLRPHAEQVIAQIRSALAGKAAVASSSHNNEIASLAIDSDPATRWKSGSMQMPGIWYMIDLKAELSLRGVDLLLTDARPNDYPRGLEVYVSNSMEHFGKPVAVVQGQSPVTPITFDQPVHGRFIRLVCTQVDRAHWSIYDIKLHTSAPAASSAK